MNRMKKFMALFLAVVLIAQTGFAASAQESASPVPLVQSETPTGTELQDETGTTEQQPEDSKDETTGETTETGQDGEDAAVGEVDGEQPGNPSEGTGTEEDGQAPPADQDQNQDQNQEQDQNQNQGQDQEQQQPSNAAGDGEGTEVGEPTEEEKAEADGTEALDASDALLEEELETLAVNELKDGVNIVRESAEGLEFNIDEGKVVMIASPDDSEEPIVFDNCTFNLSGETVKISGNQDGISYNNGETVTKIFISGNVEFNNCTFVTEEGATKTTSAGYDAAIYFFSGDINLKDCTLSAEEYNGQFLGLYGSSGAVTFDNCDISTVGNKNGWSYAMYGGSVLKLVNGSSMTATGMSTDSGNTNAFYSGDNRTGYDAIFVEDSTIDFSDNAAGGFAINNVNIHVDNSEITVNNNLGNGCNSGYWIVNNSTITMNGNRGGHALSCIGFEMTDSKLEVLHNGYAGVYIQSKDSSLTNCTVDIRCNGEKLLSYSAGDMWLQGHKLTVKNCTSEAWPGAAWLGGVGRTGEVSTQAALTEDESEVKTVGSSSVVAYDLNTNAADNLKSNTQPVLTEANVIKLNEHTLFLNPFMETAYARGNAENTASNNDADLFEDDRFTERADIIGKDNAKIGILREDQLSHHKYDWDNGEITDDATADTYGVVRYACTDVCADYVGHTADHANSFDCEGTYIYAPLVGLTFDANTTDTVTGMPDAQTQITYGGIATAPETVPTRESGSDQYTYVFGGWYVDPECTQEFDFSTALTENWTVVYAKWTRDYAEGVDPEGHDINITKTAEQLNENDETTVQLGIGSTEERNKVAVLFVLDYSTSVNVRNAAADMLKELASKDKTDVKVGVVNYWADADEGQWTTITPDTDVDSLLKQTQTGGTNYHAGLLSAQELLASDEIEGYTTYLITISDGITYLWTDEETGETMSVWYQTAANGEETSIQNTLDVYQMKYGYGVEIPEEQFNSLTEGDAAAVEKFEKTKPHAEIYKSQEKPTPDEEERFLSFKDEGVRENYLIGNEIAVYKTASVYRELANSVDYAYAFKLDEGNWTNYPYGEQLMDYLASVSDGGEITESTAKSTFDTIKNQILYAIERGTVTDIIGNDFDLTSVDSITLFVGGTEVAGVVDAANANVKNFGTEDENGVYPYSVEYVPGAAGEEQLIWTINVPVENANRLVLSYGLKLVNKSTTAGTYGQYDRDGSQGYDGIHTNVSAVLDYETTTGDTGSKNFPRPTVSYTVVDHPATINITKKVQNSSGAATNVNATFYAAVFTDPQFTNRFGDVVELKLNGTSQVTVSVTVEAPADGSSRSYYVTETDKNGNVITGGESFGYQIGIEGSMVTVSESAPTGSVTITNKQVASGNQGDGSNGGGSTGGGSSSGSGSSSSQTVTSAQTGDNTNLLLPIAVVVIAAAALTVCLVVYRRKRS